MQLPFLIGYRFGKVTRNPNIDINLKPGTEPRPYQLESLSKMFARGRAHPGGLFVLPCGASKSLMGVMAYYTVYKEALIVCSSNVSSEQWKQQFKM